MGTVKESKNIVTPLHKPAKEFYVPSLTNLKSIAYNGFSLSLIMNPGILSVAARATGNYFKDLLKKRKPKDAYNSYPDDGGVYGESDRYGVRPIPRPYDTPKGETLDLLHTGKNSTKYQGGETVDNKSIKRKRELEHDNSGDVISAVEVKEVAPSLVRPVTGFDRVGFIRDLSSSIKDDIFDIIFIPDEIAEDISANWDPVSVRGGTSEIFGYNNTSSRTTSLTIQLYDDFCPKGIVKEVNWLKSLVYPSPSEQYLEGHKVYIKVGQVCMYAIVNSISVTNKKPMRISHIDYGKEDAEPVFIQADVNISLTSIGNPNALGGYSHTEIRNSENSIG